MYFVYLDFEGLSECDIKKRGGYKYAMDPSTRLTAIGFMHQDDEHATVIKQSVICHPSLSLTYRVSNMQLDADCIRLMEFARDPECIFVAHNAFFEQVMWERHMTLLRFPSIPIERWRCTMAKCYAHSLPGSLEAALKALRLPIQKDMQGAKALLKLCKPKKDGTFYTYKDCPDDWEKMYSYCGTDVEGVRAINKALRDLSPREQRLWFIDQRINMEGLNVDVPAIRKAIALANEHKERLMEIFRNATDGDVDRPTQRDKLRMWLSKNGVEIPNTKKGTLQTLLKRPDLDYHVAEAIEVALEFNKASLAKYGAMLDRMDEDGVIREIYQYHAAHPGRWGGRGVQFQNLARPDENIDVEQCIDTYLCDDVDYDLFCFFYGDPLNAISKTTRGVVIAPPDHEFFGGDFGQIEARMTAYFAGEEYKLQAYRDGKDLYCIQASGIYGYEITKAMKDKRQVGKAGDLSLGFEGGIHAFGKMSKVTYNVDLHPVYADLWANATQEERDSADWSVNYYWETHKDDEDELLDREEARVADLIKQYWRRANPNIVKFWRAIETAAITAVKSNKPQTCGVGATLTWFTHGIFLYCKLPSGRCIAYPYPKLVTDKRGNDKLTYFGPVPGTQNKVWSWIDTYGGKLTENVVQASARDVQAEAIERLELIYPVRLHTHDEVASPVFTRGTASMEEFKAIMVKSPRWATNLPIHVDTWQGVRYGK